MSGVIVERRGPAAWITFNRPAAHNAMTWEMYARLEAACDEMDADEGVRVVLLRGAGGRAFVAGTDIGQFTAFRTAADGVAYEARLDRVLARVEALRAPTLALVQGVAAGFGALLALVCDLRLGTPATRIGAPIARTLGNCLSLANYARLVELVGPARTKELLFTARFLDAAEAQALGLLNEVLPDDALESRAEALAARLASHAPLTLRVTKEAVRRILAARRPLEAEDLIRACYGSDDFREGVASFLEKRPARWTGR